MTKILRSFVYCIITTAPLLGVADDSIDTELTAAKAHFAQEKEADTWWYYGWLGFSSTVFATSTTLYYSAEKDSRLQKAQPVSMAVSSVGVATLILFKPKSFAAQQELSTMPEGTLEEKKAKLKKSEEWLAVAAARQRFTTGFIAQAGTIGFLGLASLADAVWFNGPWFALLRFATSLAVAEFKIFTQPTYSRDRWEGRRKDEPFQWTFRMSPGEIALVAYF